MAVFIATRVCRVVGALYLLEGGVGIDLRGCETGVPEQTLYGTYIRAVVEHRGGKSMPQNVWRVLLEGGYLAHTCTDDVVERCRRHGIPIAVSMFLHKKRATRGRACQDVVSRLTIVIDCSDKVAANGYDAFLTPLTKDAYLRLRGVHIAVGEPEHLGTAHARLVEHLDDEVVAECLEAFDRVFLIRVELVATQAFEVLHLALAEEDGQGFVSLGGDDGAGDIHADQPHTQHKLVETAQGRQPTLDATGRQVLLVEHVHHPQAHVIIRDILRVKFLYINAQELAPRAQVVMVLTHGSRRITLLNGDIVEELLYHIS